MRIALLIGDQAYTPKIGMLANSRNDVALFERLRSWKREQICRRGSRGDSQGRADATDVCCDGEVISESTMLGKAGVKGVGARCWQRSHVTHTHGVARRSASLKEDQTQAHHYHLPERGAPLDATLLLQRMSAGARSLVQNRAPNGCFARGCCNP